jgi:protein-S-isoprenylcysteine O-methyltransferase Ste14
MRPLVFSAHAHHLYTIAFVVALLIWYVPERVGSVWLRSSRDPTARKQDHGSFYALIGATVAGWLAGFMFASRWTGAAIPWLRPEVTIAGIVLILLGVALRWWSIITLGRYFTLDVAVRPTQSVVQSGPYRYVRHPSYSGLLLSTLGLGLALTNWASLAVVLAGVLLGLFYRVRVEERALVDALGQPYVDYMRRTKRFIPCVL